MTAPNTQSTTAETQKSGAYVPKDVEQKWTDHWFENRVFDLDINPDKPKFSIALPPPNITGSLHMGHALNGTLQDVLIRLKRMQGYNVLWQPGTDHAGISTQLVVERQLKKEGLKRREMGREAFLKKVWAWREQYGNQILSQYKRLGVSFNWDRVAFTLDETYVKAVYRAFKILYDEGYIYRGKRITNWCPSCLTSVSDLEVEHEETKGHLWFIKYPLVDGSGHITIATVRPETMTGDVAVAVNPNDKRYEKFKGKSVRQPFTDQVIPIIQDEYVDREFGTGALKITPAHDANDWEISQRHNLPIPVVIDAEGKLAANEYVPSEFHGKDRFAARKQIVAILEEKGFLEETKDYVHGVAKCERCNTVIEPYLSDQWYVKMKDLAQPAIKVVEEERIEFVPKRYASTYLDWMNKIRDWNISRQLWWGHRIPIWTCKSCAHIDAFEEAPNECLKCKSSDLEQDPDVLDTWFSSALWPFATLGWPDTNNVIKTFYPTTLLSTAREIINLWVSRMIFTSLKFMGTIPFKTVVIHPVVQTPDGKRMSKSKGNVIDPLDMIDKYGADANRFWFASVGVKGDQDVRFREEKLEEHKRFANKLWNAGKFVLSQLEGYKISAIEPEKLSLADSWILHRYNILLQKLQDSFHHFDFDNAARDLHEFIWDYFCDWYLEIAKVQLQQEGHTADQTKRVLQQIFEGLLRALHPIMPFITEELWSRTPKSPLFANLISIMFAPYPREDLRFLNEEADSRMNLLIRVIRAVRNIRQTYNIPPSVEVQLIIESSDQSDAITIDKNRDYIQRLARIKSVSLNEKQAMPKMAASEVIGSIKLFVPLGDLIDISKTKEKILQRKNAIEKDLARVSGILGNADFKNKAPKEKVDDLESQLKELQNQIASVNAQLSVLEQ